MPRIPGPDERWQFNKIGPDLGDKVKLLVNACLNDRQEPGKRRDYTTTAIAQAIRIDGSRLGYAMRGTLPQGRTEYIYVPVLQKLADFFELQSYLGSDAWAWLTPEATTRQLELELRRVGYGNFKLESGRTPHPVDGQLAWLVKHCELTRRGLSVIRARDIEGPNQGQQRGAGVIDYATELDRETWSSPLEPGDDFVVRVDAPAGSHVVLFLLCEQAPPPHFALCCLAPSYRAGTQLAGNGVLPASRDAKGHRGFIAGDEPGRIDLLAFVTPHEPLALPFQPDGLRFHVVEPENELAMMRETLTKKPLGLRVLHAPVRVAFKR